MPPELTALLDTLYLPLAAAAAGAFFGVAIERLSAQRRRQAWRDRNRGRWRNERAAYPGPVDRAPTGNDATKPPYPDAADQLRIVMSADFETQPLLNKSEARVFKELDRMVIGRNPGWQVMAQVSLGEVLRSADTAAYRCINSKRVDLLLVDEDCEPRHAIEYQGGGHHQGTAAARDAVKREALRRAGVGYHEVVAGHTTPAELRRLIERIVTKPVTAS